MNTFKYKVYINDKPYTIYVDSSRDEYKRIVINNQELVNEKYTLSLNRNSYIIYYPITIGNDELVISIDDRQITHEYNVYLNDVSLIDGTQIDKEYNSAKSAISKGIIPFIKENWVKILIENIIWGVSAAIGLTLLLLNDTPQKFFTRLLLNFIIIPLALPLFVAGEWFHKKNIVKKYVKCFRPKRSYKE